MASASSESRQPDWDVDNAWDEELTWDWGELADDASSEIPRRPPPTREEAGDFLFDYLVDQMTSKMMNSKEACTIAYYAYHGGMEALKQIALSPQSSTGHFNEKVKKALHMDVFDQRLAYMDVPGHSPAAMGRQIFPLPYIPPS